MLTSVFSVTTKNLDKTTLNIRLYVLKGKSGNMLSFKKSSDPDFLTDSNKITIHKLDLLLKEQVEQRKDLSVLNSMLKQLLIDKGLQRQVDEYFEETSPQTEPEEHQRGNAGQE